MYRRLMVLWHKVWRIFHPGIRYDCITARDGAWNDPATWKGGNVPQSGQRIAIYHDVHHVGADVAVGRGDPGGGVDG